MANAFIGVGLVYGFPGGPGATVTGFADMSQLQTAELSDKANKEQIKDKNGNTAALAYTDHERGLVLDFIPTNGTAGANSGSITLTALPGVGSTLAITDSNFTPMAGTYAVDDVSVSRSNTKALSAKISLSKYLNNTVP